MKTILIATDFSRASRNASVYGWQLAQAMKAKVILFTAYHVSHPIAAISVQVSHFDVMKQIEIKLKEEAVAITGGDGLRTELVCEEGTPLQTIIAIAKEKEADLIIIGMQGGGSKLRNLLGSTSGSLIRGASVQVLVVPENAKFTGLKTILYASDIFMDTTIHGFERIQWITNYFSSKLHVVRVMKDDYEALREQVNLRQNLRPALMAVKMVFHFPVNENISNGLHDFITEQPIDLIVMMPHKHDWLQRIFVKSETKDMVFHTHVPVLVLPEMRVEAIDAGAFQSLENYSSGK